MIQKKLQISYQSIALFGLGVMTAVLTFWLANAAGAAVPAKTALAGPPPQLVSYQGQVDIDGTAYDGTGFFKFAVVDSQSGDGAVNYWANDGTASGEPGQTVPLTVSGGLFDILLGDTSVSGITTAMADTVFAESDTYLRVWFSEELNGPFDALEPNQRIGSVPYSLRASHAESAAYAETGSAMVPSGAVMFFDIASCPSGWTELTNARGRTLVGLPNGGTLGGTIGTALADLENRNHSHAVNPASFASTSNGSHSHTTGEPTKKGAVSLAFGSNLIAYGEDDHLHSISNQSSHTHNVNVPNTTSSDANTSDVIPYIQLLACRKD